jgi:hypothetical protein
MDNILSWILGIMAIIGIVCWVFTAVLPNGSKQAITGGGYLLRKYMKNTKSHKKRK